MWRLVAVAVAAGVCGTHTRNIFTPVSWTMLEPIELFTFSALCAEQPMRSVSGFIIVLVYYCSRIFSPARTFDRVKPFGCAFSLSMLGLVLRLAIAVFLIAITSYRVYNCNAADSNLACVTAGPTITLAASGVLAVALGIDEKYRRNKDSQLRKFK